MNVTVLLAPAVQKVCHKTRLELGVPTGAPIGELVDTLLLLYPALKGLCANDQKKTDSCLRLVHVGNRLWVFATKA